MPNAKVYGVSGGPYQEIRAGWALLSRIGGEFWQGVPHYWRRVDLTDRYVSSCGLRGEVARDIRGNKMIFHPGDFLAGRCSRCSLKRSREVSGR